MKLIVNFGMLKVTGFLNLKLFTITISLRNEVKKKTPEHKTLFITLIQPFSMFLQHKVYAKSHKY